MTEVADYHRRASTFPVPPGPSRVARGVGSIYKSPPDSLWGADRPQPVWPGLTRPSHASPSRRRLGPSAGPRAAFGPLGGRVPISKAERRGWPGHNAAMTGLFPEESAASPCQAQRKNKSNASCSPIRAGSTPRHPEMAADRLWREVVTFTADLGQGEELGPARAKAETARRQAGEHLRRGPARGIRARLCVPDVPRQRPLRGPLSAGHLHRAAADRQDQIDIARKVGADAVAHGATGKGNDQVRFELTYLRAGARHQDHRALARMGLRQPRRSCIDFAEKHQIPIAKDKRGEAPFSVDANLLHSSSEGKVLEDPAVEAAAIRLPAHRSPGGRARQADHDRDRLRDAAIRSPSTARRCRPATLLTAAQRTRPRQRHRPPRSGREPLCRHEVARHLRDAGRHDPAGGAPRHRVDHPRPRRGAPEGRADAPLCGADL